MHNLLLIIQREFRAKVKSKAYLVLIFLSPLLMIGMFMAIFYFASKEEKINFVKTSLISITTPLVNTDILENHPHINIESNHHISYHQAKVMVDEGTYNGVVFTNDNLEEMKIYGDKKTPVSSLKSILTKHRRLLILKNNKVSPFIISKIKKTNIVEVIQKNESEVDIKKWVKRTVAIGCGYLIMMFVIIYGNSVMRSIIEEKNSRVIELMVCTVKPFWLMLGKIIGNALAGILQFIIWGLLILLGLFILQSNFPTHGEELEKITQIFDVIWQINYAEIIGSFIVFFLSGYLLYSSFYAAVGAAVNSETDTQQFVHPILLPLMFAVYIGIVVVVNDNSNGNTAILFSLIPLTSPIVMLMRIPFGVPVWQIILSLSLLLVSFITTVYIASKIYRIGILSYGNKPTVRQLIKWMFQKQ